MTRICFVCLGNICRSPTAEAVMGHLVAAEGLESEVQVESAGTGGWHVGEPPDPRAVAEARRRGLAMDGTGRRFEPWDFDDYDLVIAMDGSNRSDLVDMAPDATAASKVRLLREFDPDADRLDDLDVPDPYGGGPEGFARVFEMVESACRGLLDEIRRPA